MTKSKKNKLSLTMVTLIALVVLVFFSPAIYDKLASINKQSGEKQYLDMAYYSISDKYIIKTEHEGYAKENISKELKIKNLGDYPFGYTPINQPLQANDEVFKLDGLEFNIIFEPNPDTPPVDNPYHKNNVHVEVRSADANFRYFSADDIKKSKLLPKLAQSVSKKTDMNCFVLRHHNAGGRFKDVECIWEDPAQELPIVILSFMVNRDSVDSSNVDDIFHISRVFKFKTILKEQGLIVSFAVKNENLDQWKEVNKQINRMLKAFQVKL